MNDSDIIADLKQFIIATISQQTTDLRTDTKRVEAKIDDLSSSVADALDISNEAVDKQLQDHEHRITKLERHIV
jgi:hypothetical protein